MKLKLVLFALFVMVATFAHTVPNSNEDRRDSGEVKIVSIKMQDYYFEPDKITIEQGTTVEWINTGKHAHTVTDENESWDSGNLEPGEKFLHRFDEKGIFKYDCVPHKKIDMVGKIIVK